MTPSPNQTLAAPTFTDDAAAYDAAHQARPTYTDPTLTPGVTVMTTTHIAELRAAALTLWWGVFTSAP